MPPRSATCWRDVADRLAGDTPTPPTGGQLPGSGGLGKSPVSNAQGVRFYDLKRPRKGRRERMKVQRTISLDQRTAELAGRIPNLSEWVRARLLAFDEGVIDEFAEKLANMSDRRLLAIVHARLSSIGRTHRLGEEFTDQIIDAQGALYALAEVLKDEPLADF